MKSAFTKINSPLLKYLTPFFAWLFSILIISFPIFDNDLYWHLANGRAMIDSQQIINKEIFSYTHLGEHFVNHEWLSQSLFFLLWDKGGPSTLFALKITISSIIFILIYLSATSAGKNSKHTAIICMICFLAGIQRFHIRPEIFTLLNMASLGYLLRDIRFHSKHHYRIWLIPFIFLAWDWLHGAIIGFAFFTIFLTMENFKDFSKRRNTAKREASSYLKRLNICFLVTISLSIINPYGLRTYDHFLTLARGAQGADRITELQPIWNSASDYIPFIFMLVWMLMLFLINRRKLDITDVTLVLAFGFGAMQYNRLVATAAIVIAPIIASNLSDVLGDNKRPMTLKAAQASLLAAFLVLISVGYNEKIIKRTSSISSQDTFILPSETAFGYKENELYTPAGSTRFIKAMNLKGNMYNNGNFGGYLSFYSAPERPIFQYNMPPIFGDTTRFSKSPKLLDQWNIQHAMAGTTGELTNLFPAEKWAWIYSDYVSTVVIKRIIKHQAIIDKYELQYFTPEQSLSDFRSLSKHPQSKHRLAFEMGVYLSYMNDERIASRWKQLLSDHPELRKDPQISELLPQVAKMNRSTALQQ